MEHLAFNLLLLATNPFVKDAHPEASHQSMDIGCLAAGPLP
jgi:hypothetical protein